MGWQIWLGAPVAVTLAAALMVWWQARPRPTPSVHARVRDHARFLEELARHSAQAPDLPSSVALETAAATAAGLQAAPDIPVKDTASERGYRDGP